MSKKQGEFVELRFMVECLKRDYIIAPVYGDNASYDCIVDVGGKLTRVQIKSTGRKETTNRQNRYYVSCAHGADYKSGYTKEDADIIAAYVIPVDVWYIVPIHIIKGKKNMALYPHRPEKRKDNYEVWRDRWDLF